MKKLIFPTFIFLISYLTKIHRIEKGNFVIWDEAHFGKFSQKYLNRTFYFDVHPPLGKMLTAFSGFLFGQKEEFDFGSKENFPEWLDYSGMRRFHAFIASFTPFFGYLILRNFGFSLRRAFVLSLLFVFENGTTSISRLILLDSHLLAFKAGTIWIFSLLCTCINRKNEFCIKKSTNYDSNKILATLGCFIGCVMSIKWIGLFTTLQIGIYIIFDLYLKTFYFKALQFFRYFLKRVLFLIILPFSTYLLFFYVHFLIVNKSGPDDTFMSSEFQLGLKGENKTKKYVYYGKGITIKTDSGYLHSHLHSYPKSNEDDLNGNNDENISNNDDNISNSISNDSIKNDISNDSIINSNTIINSTNGTNDSISNDNINSTNENITNSNINSNTIINNINNINGTNDSISNDNNIDINLLQVTNYSHKDNNNHFYFQKINNGTEAKIIKNGDNLVLLHAETGGYLEQSDEPAYLSAGNKTQLRRERIEPEAIWIIEFQNDFIKNEEELKAISTKFYLKNASSNLYLCHSHKNYPDWGFNQGEIICSNQKDSSCLFNIEDNFYSEGEEYLEIKPKFFTKFLELQKTMFNINRSFMQDPDLEPDRIVSRAYEWPVLTRGLRMSQWHEKEKFYMFMNPFLHYSVTIGIIITPIIYIIRRIRTLRGIHKMNLKYKDKNSLLFLYISWGGWAFHYLPFFLIGRVLYLHHYFPALFFGTLNLCSIFRKAPFKIILFYVFISILVFLIYSPLTYGFVEEDYVKRLQVLPSWDFI